MIPLQPQCSGSTITEVPAADRPRGPGEVKTLTRSRRHDPELFPEVREALETLVPKKLRKRITPEASILADLGLDSLKVVELTMLLEKQLGRPVFLPEWIASVEDPAELTVASLARFLADKR
jgi:acyl carrier protein